MNEEEKKPTCITCDETMLGQPKWSCECCGLMVGTSGDHEGCGDNIRGTVVCNFCYQEGHEVQTMIADDDSEVIMNSTCQGWDNQKHFGDKGYEIISHYTLGPEGERSKATNRQKMTDALVERDIESIFQHGDIEFLDSVLRGDGWVPYNQLTDDQLKAE